MGTTTGAEETMDDLLKQIEESRRKESLELYNDLTVLAEITGGDDLFYAAALEAKKSSERTDAFDRAMGATYAAALEAKKSNLGEDKVKEAAKRAYAAQLLTASVAVMGGHEQGIFYALTPAYTASEFNIPQDEKLSIAESVGKKILETAEQYRQFKQVSHKR